jgi:hypothetical protein
MTQKSYTVLHQLHRPGLSEAKTVPDPLHVPSRPCAVCQKLVPVGQGVRIGTDGPRVCMQELARPLEELTALLRAKTK